MSSDASNNGKSPFRSRGGEWVTAAVVFLALFQICYWTQPGVFESEDFIKFYQPNLHFLISNLSNGEIPWWNPHIGLGRPFVSDLQNAVFYPPTYLFFLGQQVGLYLILSLHLFAALVGMRLLARSFGVAGTVAWLAGFVFVFSGPVASLLFRGMIYYVLGLCYLPWLMWVALRFGKEWSSRRVGLFGLLLGLQFLTGHPQTFWIGLVGLGLFVVAWKILEREQRSPGGIGMPLLQMTAGVVLAGVLTAVAWMPFLDLIAEGNRTGATVEQAGFGTSRLPYLFSLYCIPPYQFVVNSAGNWFIGAAWTVAGLVGWITIRDARIRALIVVALFALAFSFGTKTFLYGLCFDVLPGTAMFRFPIRMGVWLSFALLISGTVFLGQKDRSRQQLWAAGVVLVILLLASAAGEDGPQPRWQAVIFLLVGAAIVFVGPRLPRCGDSWPLFLGALLAVELMVTNSFYRHSYSMEGRYGMSPVYEATGPIRQLLATRPGQPPEMPPPRACLPPIVAPRNLGMMLGYANFDAYTSLFLKRPWEALHAAVGADSENVLNTTLNDQIYQRGPFGIPEVSIDFGVDLQRQQFVINPNPLPRAHLSYRDGPIPARFNHFAPSELRLRFTTHEPAVLVLNEAWFPGWRAMVNGVETEVTPVNHWMRGVSVGVGDQEIVLTFLPRRIGWGAVITLLGIAIVVVCLRKEFPPRRAHEHPSAGSPALGNDR